MINDWSHFTEFVRFIDLFIVTQVEMQKSLKSLDVKFFQKLFLTLHQRPLVQMYQVLFTNTPAV